MRHRVYGKHLGRNKNQRTALFKGLLSSLIIHQSIETTEPKAKAIKPLIDRIINNAKSPTAKRLVSEFFNQKSVEQKLAEEILPRLGERTSGYASVVRVGRRLGDGAMIVRMSLLLEEQKPTPKKEKVAKTEIKTDEVQPKKAAKKEAK